MSITHLPSTLAIGGGSPIDRAKAIALLCQNQRTTADTGIDAITHAIEAYVSQRANPYSDSQAEFSSV